MFFRTLLLTALCLPGALYAQEPVSWLLNAHSHNDYAHARPLLDALDQGFCSIEADVFLNSDQLLVGHTEDDLTPERSLEKLYLDPLRERVRANGGRVYPGGPDVTLLIDFKTDMHDTWVKLDSVLKNYADMLTVYRDTGIERKAVSVIISGNRPKQDVWAQKERLAAIDGRIPEFKGDFRPDQMPIVSMSWEMMFKWKGEGEIPEKELARLKDYAAQCHAKGMRLRFWALPKEEAMWPVLFDAGVDILNADNLPALRAFLLSRGKANLKE